MAAKKAKAKRQFAQGDVLFTRIGNSTKELKPLDKPVPILEGEASGHIHNLHGQAMFYRATELGLDLGTIDVGPKGAAIKHEINGKPTGDHKDFDLPPGKYKVTRQREYRAEQEAYVAD